MSRIKRPSPALVVAILALVAAIAVPAFALTKKEKRVVRNVANAQITKRAPRLTVASAQTATQAQNATRANGVKPIKVSFAAPSGTPATAFVNERGVRISGECTAPGEAKLDLTNTGPSGALMQFAVVNADGSTDAGQNLGMGSGTSQSLVTVAPPRNVRTVTVTYRGAAGTEVSGDLVIARGAVAAQCVIAGTLFVG
jgi:hypothetical protein